MSDQSPRPSLYAEYELDTVASEQEGTWVTFKGDIQVKLRSENSESARKWAHKRARSLRSVVMQNDGTFPPAVSDKNDVDILAEQLVVDWAGVTDRAGNPLPCTPANVRKIFTELPSFRREVLTVARMDETFRKAALDAQVGNSAPSSEDSSPRADGLPTS